MTEPTRTSRLRRFARDERGAIGPMIAMLGVSLLMAAGLALDVGLYYSGERDLRSATEAAALAAAMKPAEAQQRAAQYFRDNGYADGSLKSLVVTPGYYCADKGVSIVGGASRFKTVSQGCAGSTGGVNAVQVTATATSRQFLTGLFGDASPIPDLSTTAKAARIDEAGIAVTSGLLGLTSGGVTDTLVGAVNGVLRGLVGIELNIAKPEVQALMSGNVDAGLFFDALAPANYSGTYGELIDGTYQIGAIAAAAAAAAEPGATKNALTRTAGLLATVNYPVPLKDLFKVGVWKNMPVGEAGVKPALRAGLNAYQLLTYAAQAGPGVINLSDAVNLLVPKTSTAPKSTLAIKAMASNAMGRPRFAFGPVGETTVGTSMIRLQVDLQLLDIGIDNVVNTSVKVPLVIDVAAADATVKNIDCTGSANQKADTKVQVDVNSGEVNVYLGDPKNPNVISKVMPPLSEADFNQSYLVDIRLLGLIPLVGVKGRAVVTSVAGRNHALSELGPGGRDSIVPLGQANSSLPNQYAVVGNKAQVGQTIQALNTSLLGPGGLSACALSLVCVSPGNSTVVKAVSDVLGGVSGVLSNVADPLLDNVLAALGVELGHATVWTTGVRCGVPVLI